MYRILKIGLLFFFMLSIAWAAQNITKVQQTTEQGDTNAQYELGVIYFKGKNVEKDKRKASFWYGKSAEQSHEYAPKALERLNKK